MNKVCDKCGMNFDADHKSRNRCDDCYAAEGRKIVYRECCDCGKKISVVNPGNGSVVRKKRCSDCRKNGKAFDCVDCGNKYFRTGKPGPDSGRCPDCYGKWRKSENNRLSRIRHARKERYCPTCDRVLPKGKTYCDEVCQGYGIRLKWGVRDCPQCSNEFLPTAKDQTYCTQECQWASMRDRVECTCKQCGKQFTAKKDRTTFCSRKCAFAFKSLNSTGSTRGIEPIIVSRCAVCGSYLSDFRASTCGDECYKERERQRARELALAKHNAKPRKCKCCKKVFTPEYGDKRKDFCSRECGKKHNRRGRVKSFNGRARKQLRRMYGDVLPMMYESISRVAVLERDNWTCGICGQPIDRNAKAPHPLSPSVDHVIALASGGSHTYDNVQAAHFECNWRKGTKDPSEAQDITPDYEAICC